MVLCKSQECKVYRDIKRKDMYNICQDLAKIFGEGYEFEMEKISGGGIIIKKWPDKKEEHKKAIRFMMYETLGKPVKYPWVYDPIKDFKDNNEIFFKRLVKYKEKYCKKYYFPPKDSNIFELYFNVSAYKIIASKGKYLYNDAVLEWKDEEIKNVLHIFARYGIAKCQNCYEQIIEEHISLLERVKELEIMNYYSPDGEGAKEAKKDFEKLI